jgi:iron complex outermembrane receptor protein
MASSLCRLARVSMALCAAVIIHPSYADEESGDSDAALPHVSVFGTRDKTRAQSVTKGGLSDLETPQNIQVLSADLLRDQGAKVLEDALRNVAGVMPGGYYQSWDYFRIRGFDASGYIFQDNLAFDSGVQLNAELYGLEQIEILKGPASSLYGEGSLGGMVNLVSKRPRAETFLSAGVSYGSYESYEAHVDGGAILLDNPQVEGRLVAVQRHSGTFVDFAGGNDRLYVAPSLTWHMGESTTLTLLSSYQHDRLNMGFPLTYVGAVVAGPLGRYPLDRYTGEPGRSNRAKGDRDAIGYEFSHSFNSVLSFSQNARYAYNTNDWDHIMYSSFLEEDGRTLERYPYSATGHWSDTGVDSRFTAVFSTGSVAHKVMAGLDYFNYDYHWRTFEIDYSDPASYMPLDLYNPTYGAPFPAYASSASVRQIVRDTGFYVQEHAKIDRWTLTLSGRWDHAKAGDSWSGTFTSHSDTRFVPRVGGTFAVSENSVIYASYSESFLPQAGSTFTGGSLKPESGEQWEVGTKASLIENRLDLTASLFQLTRQNVATADPVNPGFSNQTGEQRSRGVELDARAALTPHWQALLAYAYVDAKVTKDNTIPVGDRPQNAPPTSVSLWSKYTMGAVGVGAGVYHYSSQTGDLPNTFSLPGYTLVNAALYYAFGRVEAQLNVHNLFDTRYFSGSYNNVYVQPGAPRTFSMDVTWHP